MEPTRHMHPALAAVIVVALIGAITVGIILLSNNNDTADIATDSPAQTSGDTATPQSSDEVVNTYQDGTYSAAGTYATPGGRESIELSVTLVDGEITDTSLQQNAKTGEAEEYQSRFASGYKTLVVGKNIDEVSVSRVAGSSLTSNGFEDALDQIKDDARA